MERLSDAAINIINDLHTERLDYTSEYLPLIDALNRLAEYEDAEADGRLVVLPCKVGDTVYMPYKGRAHKLRVQGISVSISGNDVILHFGGYPVTNVWGSEVGRTVFLTKEEAEQALKGECK